MKLIEDYLERIVGNTICTNAPINVKPQGGGGGGLPTENWLRVPPPG